MFSQEHLYYNYYLKNNQHIILSTCAWTITMWTRKFWIATTANFSTCTRL